VEKNQEKAWDQNYVTDRKWWTRLSLQDKIWEWPGDEAMMYMHIPSTHYISGIYTLHMHEW